MRILCVGDVCGAVGCRALQKLLPALKRREGVDFTVVNGENAAEGNGLLPKSAEAIFAAGADVITGGNHTLRRREIYTLLDENPRLLRPDNIETDCGHGYVCVDCGYTSVAVVNLSGQVYLPDLHASNPFLAADAALERAKKDGARIVLLDFHAEATSEKRALGFDLDGRATAVFGTHTHVQTSDAQVLPGGTGYCTDLGMTGTVQSVLGVRADLVIDRMKRGAQNRFALAAGECALEGCLFECDAKTGRCLSARTIRVSESEGIGHRKE